ncbi:undecaprenyldiphospho-muramoylpentapeptide beta-N-acetylglucosaminyltransferase [Weissella ceti]|uniref:undecaprenyldiphospho-muramoylpentapeptide beta-N-acetylglucosaminyltransferase n=1 Tax=Weissella ceti TaxID=759620 RepID=UPI001BCC4287|nr:undecaprenyldiphospho-muramoylpentapeptide beta-N-acetylglucosaminyltransferase [Weissella ceti]QVK12372.1 undecaprenyldiphospho-muramoylpentapeptide beta-N-acetylglucosaminyltransferase [Weissella ceti]
MRIVVSGGGTGGHIYPALATIKKMQERDPELEVLYIGGERGLEKDIVPAAGVNFKAIAIQGFNRSAVLDNFKTVKLFLAGTNKVRKMLREFQPDVVIGTGGYVSGPVLYAAQMLKIPTVIHEQNSVVGVTNKFLSRKATKVGVAFPAAMSAFKKGQATVVGNPRAQEVVEAGGDFDWNALGLSEDLPTVLVFGGSQGALKLNRAMLDSAVRFAERDYQVIFATGTNRFEEVTAEILNEEITIPANMSIVPYISNMPALMPLVDLVVGRAGATSLAEQTALGKPMVLIPSPYVTNDHQTKNAQSLVQAGAATMLTEAELAGDTLFEAVDNIMSNVPTRQTMAEQAKKLGVPDAADQFANLVESTLTDYQA